MLAIELSSWWSVAALHAQRPARERAATAEKDGQRLDEEFRERRPHDSPETFHSEAQNRQQVQRIRYSFTKRALLPPRPGGKTDSGPEAGLSSIMQIFKTDAPAPGLHQRPDNGKSQTGTGNGIPHAAVKGIEDAPPSSSSGMPGPVSDTIMTGTPCSYPACRSTLPPSGV